MFFLFISFVCSFFLFQLKQNGNEWNGSTHFVLLKEERTTHTLLSRSFRSFPFPFAQFNSRLHFFSLQLNWSERRERGKRGVRRMKREKTQRKVKRKHVVLPSLSFIHLFFCSSLTILSVVGWMVKGTLCVVPFGLIRASYSVITIKPKWTQHKTTSFSWS